MIAVPHSTISSKSPASQQRLDWVDYARGIAIIFVVFRHTMVGLNRSGLIVPTWLYQIQEFTVNFRMPAFFMLSGIFLAKAVMKKDRPDVFKKKVSTLLYPYLLWTTIFISIQILLSDYTNASRTPEDYLNIILQPRSLDHMWYLLALFTTTCLYLFSSRLIASAIAQLTLGVILHFLSYFVREYSLISDLGYYYIFLVLGVVLSQNLISSQGQHKYELLKVVLLLLPFFAFAQWYWLEYGKESLLLMPVSLGIILLACVFFYFFCRWARKQGIFTGLINIGRHSVYIYILHLLIIAGFRILATNLFHVQNVYVLVFGSLVLSIVIPILAYRNLGRFGFHYLFSLEKPRKKNIN
ncbi:MAG: acyltransferase family protein [Flavisolibacter sp.]